jgi:hypothetical protein
MAEDVLFAWRHRDGPDDMLLELGRQFYQRLKRRTDDELVEGNLPRAEVEQGEAEWNQTGS